MGAATTNGAPLWGPLEEAALQKLLALALAEDVGPGDLTTQALVPEHVPAAAKIVAREKGVVAGLACGERTLEAVAPLARWTTIVPDGGAVEKGTIVARLEGPARGLLVAERTILNFLGRLSGIASLARTYVDAVAGTAASVLDTRKTTPGWRALEKFAVRAGGGKNHRMALYDGVLIKDNHLAFGAEQSAGKRFTPADAVRKARDVSPAGTVLEVEVDTLDQLREVLPAAPDIVLLDNMNPDQLRAAVALRAEIAPAVRLEASGRVSLATIRAIAETGVERISVGALTHSAKTLDLGLDWE